MKRACPYQYEENNTKKIKSFTYYPANMNILTLRYLFVKQLPLVTDIQYAIMYKLYHSDMMKVNIQYKNQITIAYFHWYEPFHNIVHYIKQKINKSDLSIYITSNLIWPYLYYDQKVSEYDILKCLGIMICDNDTLRVGNI